MMSQLVSELKTPTLTNDYPEESKQIAATIGRQIGGLNRLKNFAGASNFIHLEVNGMPSLGMCLPENNSNSNTLFICLNTGLDVYEFIFCNREKSCNKMLITYHSQDIYCDQLMDIFEETTGLLLTFSSRK